MHLSLALQLSEKYAYENLGGNLDPVASNNFISSLGSDGGDSKPEIRAFELEGGYLNHPVAGI